MRIFVQEFGQTSRSKAFGQFIKLVVRLENGNPG